MSNFPYRDLRNFFEEILRMEEKEQDYIHVDDNRLDVVLKDILHCITTSDILYRCTDNSLKFHAMVALQDCLALSGRVYDYAKDVSFEMMFDQVLESACDEGNVRDEDFSFIHGLHGSELPNWSGVPTKLTKLILNLMAIHNNIRITEQSAGNGSIQAVDKNVIVDESSDADKARTIRNNIRNSNRPSGCGFIDLERIENNEMGNESSDTESTHSIQDDTPEPICLQPNGSSSGHMVVNNFMGDDWFGTDTTERSWFDVELNELSSEDALDINF